MRKLIGYSLAILLLPIIAVGFVVGLLWDALTFGFELVTDLDNWLTEVVP